MTEIDDVSVKLSEHSPNTVRKLLGSSQRGYFDPLGLINTDLVENRGELVAILSIIDLLRIGSEYRNSGIL